jgi:thioredoxin-related protein
LIGDEPTKDQIPDFEGFPTMLFIDRKGQVRLKHVGYTPQAGLEAVIEALLAEGKE